MRYQECTDEELAKACAEGDADAWSEMVLRFQDAVYSVARHRCRLGDDDAADVFQDTFETVYGKIDELRDQKSVRAWVVRIAWRKSIDLIRKERSHREDEYDDTRMFGYDRDELDHDPTMYDERQKMVVDAIDSLPLDVDRAVLACRYYEDMSYKEISDDLGIPVGSVSSILARGLKHMAGWLAERGYAPDGMEPIVE